MLVVIVVAGASRSVTASILAALETVRETAPGVAVAGPPVPPDGRAEWSASWRTSWATSCAAAAKPCVPPTSASRWGSGGRPRARDAYPDWSAVLDKQIAYLHAHRRGDPAVDAFAHTLAAAGGEEFTIRWRRRPPTSGRTGFHDVTHPEVGPLRLHVEGVELADRDDQRMFVYLPADSASRSGLDRLVGRHPTACARSPHHSHRPPEQKRTSCTP